MRALCPNDHNPLFTDIYTGMQTCVSCCYTNKIADYLCIQKPTEEAEKENPNYLTDLRERFKQDIHDLLILPMEKLIAENERLQRENQWISVIDELPPQDPDFESYSVEVLATNKIGYRAVCQYDYDKECWQYHEGCLEDVVAWQLLPKPYVASPLPDHASFKKAALAIPEVKQEYDAIGELKKSEWVSVKERLPEKMKPCYVYLPTEKNKFQVMDLIGTDPETGEHWWSMDGYCSEYPVTHWQLAEPPEEG